MSKEKEWFLRKSDGEVYGPVSLGDLRRWSVESRVLAGNEISTDKKRWHLIEDLQDLDMKFHSAFGVVELSSAPRVS